MRFGLLYTPLPHPIMRPVYETEADRIRQQKVFDYCEKRWKGFTVRPCESFAFIDGEIIDAEGNLRAFIEIKNRKVNHDRYKLYFISEFKYRAMLKISADHGKPALLIVRFDDGVYYTTIREGYEIQEGGRSDRNDPKDVESCAWIPMREFKRL